MNKALLIVLSVLSLSTTALAQPKDPAQTVLNELDQLCGDSWCEGDFNYKFEQLNCDAKSGGCALVFTMIDRNTDNETEIKASSKTKTGVQANLRSRIQGGMEYSVECRFDAFKKASDLVDKNGQYGGITDSFYEQTSECIESLEKQIRKYEKSSSK